MTTSGRVWEQKPEKVTLEPDNGLVGNLYDTSCVQYTVHWCGVHGYYTDSKTSLYTAPHHNNNIRLDLETL